MFPAAAPAAATPSRIAEKQQFNDSDGSTAATARTRTDNDGHDNEQFHEQRNRGESNDGSSTGYIVREPSRANTVHRAPDDATANSWTTGYTLVGVHGRGHVRPLRAMVRHDLQGGSCGGRIATDPSILGQTEEQASQTQERVHRSRARCR